MMRVTLSLAVVLAPLALAGDAAARRDPNLAAAVRQVRAPREGESLVTGRVETVHPSPGIWCGRFRTFQEVTYRIAETVAGQRITGTIRVRHLLLHGSSLVLKEPAALRPELFSKGVRILLLLRPEDDAWLALDVRTVDPRSTRSEDVEAIVRLVLTRSGLKEYLHPEVEGRLPVVVERNAAMPLAFSMEVHGKPVAFRPPLMRDRGPTVVFEDLVIDGEMARVRLRYDVEGVAGEVRLERRDGAWVVAGSALAER